MLLSEKREKSKHKEGVQSVSQQGQKVKDVLGRCSALLGSVGREVIRNRDGAGSEMREKNQHTY